MFGAGDYAMRVWLDPEKVAALNLTASDVVRAIREQNVQVAAGQLGAPPAPSARRLPAAHRHARPARHRGRVREHRREDRRARPDHAPARRRARRARREHLRAALAARQQARGRDPDLPAARQQRDRHLGRSARDDGEAREGLPARASTTTSSTTRRCSCASRSRRSSHTLFEAMLLVVLVVMLFLQTWRASVIPLAAVPVSLVGTLAVMHLFGFSLNALSLFGLVLAIGIVVDDAIVVVENVERNIARGLAPVAAAQQAMREVTSPIIATALVLIAVFVPTAFISGLTGQFYKQFAFTIAISTAISAFNSLTLSPALAAVLLKPHGATPDRLQRAHRRRVRLAAAAVQSRSSSGRRCATSASRAACCAARVLRSRCTAGCSVLTWLGFASVPSGFIPQQDKQYLVAYAQLPEAATLDRTEEVIRQMDEIMLAEPGVAHAVSFPGLSINGFVNSPNSGIAFAGLADFSKDGKHVTTSGRSAWEIAASLNQKLARDPGRVHRGVPAAGRARLGADRRLQGADRGPRRARLRRALRGDAEARRRRARDSPSSPNVFSGFQINAPQIRANVDRDKAQGAGRAAHGPVRDDAGLSRLALRQRLQPLRPHLPGQRASRHGVPARAGRHPAPEGPQRLAARWCRSARSSRSSRARARAS